MSISTAFILETGGPSRVNFRELDEAGSRAAARVATQRGKSAKTPAVSRLFAPPWD